MLIASLLAHLAPLRDALWPLLGFMWLAFLVWVLSDDDRSRRLAELRKPPRRRRR